MTDAQKTPQEQLFDFIADRIAQTMSGPVGSIPYVFVAQDMDGRLLLTSNMNATGMAMMCKEVGDNGPELIQGEKITGEAAAPTTSGIITN